METQMFWTSGDGPGDREGKDEVEETRGRICDRSVDTSPDPNTSHGIPGPLRKSP